jgi:hypothetical protein
VDVVKSYLLPLLQASLPPQSGPASRRLPKPNPAIYPADATDRCHRHYTFAPVAVSLEQVIENFDKYGMLDEQTAGEPVCTMAGFESEAPSEPVSEMAGFESPARRCLSDRAAIQLQFAGDPTLGPALLTQAYNSLLQLHFEFVHGPAVPTLQLGGPPPQSGWF